MMMLTIEVKKEGLVEDDGTSTVSGSKEAQQVDMEESSYVMKGQCAARFPPSDECFQ